MFRYVTSYFCVAALSAGAIGCGSSSQKCLPVVSPNAAVGGVGDLSGRANGGLDAGVNAGANAGLNAGANAAGAVGARIPPTDAELKEAASLRARAKANIDAGRLREALPDLERAFALSGDVTMLGDLGLALDAAGRFDEAWMAMYRFRAEARASYEPLRAKIDAKLGELEKKLGGLMIDTDMPGAELIVRGQVVARLPLATPIFLAPGEASVIVRGPGKPDFTVRQRIVVGAVARASAPLMALGGVGVGVAGGVAGGVGGALGGVGGALGGVGGGLGRPTGALGGVGGALGGVGGAVGGVGAPNVSGPNVSGPNVSGPNVGGAVGGVAGGVGGAVGGVGGAVGAATLPVWPIVLGVGGLGVAGLTVIASVVHSGRLDKFDANLCGKSGATAQCPAIESGLKVTTGLQVTGYLLGGIALTTGIVAFAVTRSVKAPDLDCPKVGRAAPLQLRCGVGADGTGAAIGCVGAF